jgi:hypothetical protein
MQDSTDETFFARTSVGVVAVALFLISACSASSVRRITGRCFSRQKLRYQPVSERYEDEDGTATLESETAYSYQLPRALVLLISAIGSLDSLILCVVTTRNPYSTVRVEQWLQFGAWVCLIRSNYRTLR